MLVRAGISAEKGITSQRLGEVRTNYLKDEERKNNSFDYDGWTVIANIENKTLIVRRPQIGKCPAVAEKFTLQDGTLYLRAKKKVAEAKFIPDDLSMLLWEKYGIHEICHTNPNRTYPTRFRENSDTIEQGGAFQLVWTHTDGEVSIIDQRQEQYVKETIRYGRLNQFVGNYSGLYVEKKLKNRTTIDQYPITMREAVKAFNNDEAKDLTVSNANFAVVLALDPSYEILNRLCVLYTAETDYRKIIEMLDKKLASDRSLRTTGFQLYHMAHDYWSRV